jgi:DNA-binding response OmpR family regulator
MIKFFRKKKIAVIEDDATDLDMLSDFLCAKGYNVLKIKDASLAESLIKDYKPNLIFAALMLNDFIRGDELVEKLKSDANFNVPVVGMSAQVNTDAEYFYSICDYKLTKPLSIAHINQIIAKALN